MTRIVRLVPFALAVAVAAAPSTARADDAHRATHDFAVTCLSSPPEFVSGGDALVRVDVPRTVPLSKVSVRLNGRDVTAAFRVDAAGRSMTALLSGMTLGDNVVTATSNGEGEGRPSASLVLRNHAITGPLFAGPHETPFFCQTVSFKKVNGDFLPAPIDADCSVPTQVDYVYKSSVTGKFQKLPPDARPSDLATTTTSTGATVPYVVRVETGTINRSIYEIAILHDPTTEPPPDAFTHPAGWNGRLIYTFGGGCTTGWYRQGANTGGVTDDVMLSQGYAVASSSLNVFGNDCSELLAAETMAMTKERFVEAYGAPVYTMGFGCSGGSYQQHQITDDYPGLLDGIIPGCSFPEVTFATVQYISDARLLDHYFNTLAPGAFTPAQQTAVAGFVLLASIPNNSNGARRIDPRVYCPSVLPPAQRYDPVTNPTGARCDVYDHQVNAYGRDPATGFARRPLDNVGLQYGLGALNDGTITMDQFLDLNRRIGGFDADANLVPTRTVADLQAVRAAYQTGRITNGGLGLRDVPIIDYRAYTDDNPGGDIHMRFLSFQMRERLRKANGTIANHVMLTEDFRYGYYSTRSPVLSHAITQLDEWLAGIRADASDDPLIEKIARAKPADLVDACWTRDATPVKIVEPQREFEGTCASLYPAPPAPRGVAGAPLAGDVIKCQLKPVDPADYAVPFTPAQWTELQAVFPDGVCDYGKPGVEQQAPVGTWIEFAP